MTTKISQKEYLKKYVSGEVGGSKKNKKKKKKTKTRDKEKVKIIDDDINLSHLNRATDEDLEAYAIGEDAPQIVGVIDDRPPELIAVEDYKKSYKWKSLTIDESQPSRHGDSKTESSTSRAPDISQEAKLLRRYSSDNSPPRRPKGKAEIDVGKVNARKSAKPSRFTDISPENRSNRTVTVKRENTTPDLSPPRNNRQRSNSSDLSPLRRRPHHSHESKSHRNRRSGSGSDLSPPRHQDTFRRRRRSTDLSSPKRNRPTLSIKREENSDSDLSPPRQRRNRRPDLSPVRRRSRSKNSRRQQSTRYDRSRSPSFRHRKRSNTPPRKSQQNRSHSRSQDRSSAKSVDHEKSTKTLDGKTAGLQDAKALRAESDKFRQREDALFQKIPVELSGRTADVVVRDRKTGRIRDLALESEREQEKMRKEQERQELYNRWGKGLKQVEDYKARVESDTHEYSKPLARYADDTDLDELLKKQERAGDPMLEYLKSKEKTKKDSAPSKPIYQGAYPENRFSIRPGYRWDGVDRSNGYEVKWFNVQSQRKAGEEEAYKYSTEDM